MTTSTAPSAMTVHIEPQGAAASVHIASDADPQSVAAAALADLARAQGVVLTPDAQQRLEEIAARFGAEPQAIDEVFIRWQPPQHGEAARMEWVDRCDPSASAQPVRDEQGRVDYYNAVTYVKVKQGQHVATLYPAGKGVAGLDVAGNVIPAEDGRPLGIRLDSTVKVGDDGCVIAQRDGVLQMHQRTLSITRLLEVPGCVDFSTGNIDFDGTVVVGSGVRDRFEVTSTKDIVIDGAIEGATITAGRNLMARGGMSGRGRGQLLVQGDAEVRFMDNASGTIHGDLIVHREIMNCRVTVGRDLRAEQAAVIGGRCEVVGRARIGTVGSAAEVPTLIDLPTTTPAYRRFIRVQRIVQRIEQRLAARSEAHRRASAGGRAGGTDKASRIRQATLALNVMNARLARWTEREKELRASVGERRIAGVLVRSVIHPRACFRFGESEGVATRRIRGPVVVGCDSKGNVRLRYEDGSTEPLSRTP